MKKIAMLAACALGACTINPALSADTGGGGFAALGVCDLYGVAGLTIASDDTCLLISGEIEYEYEYEVDGDTGDHDFSSEVDWELAFEAITRTDGGAASATIIFAPEDPADADSAVEISQAFVSIGDTTVLTAGLTESIFEIAEEQLILDDLEIDEIDESHVIRLFSVQESGLFFAGALEDLNGDGAIGALAGYEGGGVEAEIGGFVYNLYDVLENDAAAEWNAYGDILAEYDTLELFGAFVASHERVDTVASAGVDFDAIFLKAAWGTAYEVATDDLVHSFGFGFEVPFDPVELDVEFVTEDFETLGLEAELVVEINDELEVEFAAGFDDLLTEDDSEGTVTLIAALTENWEAEAWTGFEYDAGAGETIYGLGGETTYEPAGDMEVTAGIEGWSDGAMVVSFGAAMEF